MTCLVLVQVQVTAATRCLWEGVSHSGKTSPHSTSSRPAGRQLGGGGRDFLVAVVLHHPYAIACSALGFILKALLPDSLGLYTPFHVQVAAQIGGSG